ncbi:hypothetical protein HOC37_07965 [bacterium]|jgi:GTP-binding protein EngB required for normal cell division|nr:hypothetical protein [bacterium]
MCLYKVVATRQLQVLSSSTQRLGLDEMTVEQQTRFAALTKRQSEAVIKTLDGLQKLMEEREFGEQLRGVLTEFNERSYEVLANPILIEETLVRFTELKREFVGCYEPRFSFVLAPLVQLLAIQVQNFGFAIDFATRRVQLPIEPWLGYAGFDPEEFELFLQEAVSSMRHIKDQEIVMVGGNTNAGKSTLLNRLFGGQLTKSIIGLGGISAESSPELFKIGNEYKSQTIIPLALMEQTKEILFCDCPGFEDYSTATEEAVSALSTYLVTKTAKSVKTLIMVLPVTAFSDERGRNLKDAFRTITRFLGSNLGANQDSILFVITKAPSTTTSEQVGFAISQLLDSVQDIEVRQMLTLMLDHLDNIFVIDALDTSSQTQDQTKALFSKIMESRGIATDDFIYVPENASKNQLQGFISRVLEDTRVLMTSYFDLQNHIQRSENRLTVLAEELEEVTSSISKIRSGKLDKVSEVSELARVSEEIRSKLVSLKKTLEDEEREVASFEDEFATKKTELDTLNTSEELEHKELIYPNPPGSVANGTDGFFMLERHRHEFEYKGNPFTRVEVYCEGITHPDVGNLFHVAQVPGGFFRGLFGGTSIEELKTAFQQARVNVHAILHGPYDEFTETKSDPKKGEYEGTYRTLHYGITPKVTITVYGEKRHHPEHSKRITFISEEMVTLQKDIDKKEQDVGNIKSEIKRLKQQLVEVSSDIDKYIREQGTRKVELETEETDIQCFLRDAREQASQKKKEIESLQRQFSNVFFLLGCVDVSQVFSIPEATLDAFQEQYIRFNNTPLPMFRNSSVRVPHFEAQTRTARPRRRGRGRRR